MFEAVEGLRRRARASSSSGSPTRRRTPTSALAKQLNQRYAELTRRSSRTWRDWQHARATTSRPPASSRADDPAFAAGGRRSSPTRASEAEERLRRLLVPRDPADAKDAILEIKSGEGGEESALFAGDLLRMYTRYAERRGWNVEVLDATESDLGGYKSVTVAVKAQGRRPSPARRRTRC